MKRSMQVQQKKASIVKVCFLNQLLISLCRQNLMRIKMLNIRMSLPHHRL